MLHRLFHIARASVPYRMFIFILLMAGCASQRPPEGGPVDSEPPVVEETEPANGTVRFTGRKVTLRFSEYVQRQSFQDAVHISPLPPTPPEYDWSGKDVTIMFQDSLIANRTYVISVGTKVRDVNASNPMAANFQLAFSTGDSLDRGRFDGIVLDPDPAGVTLAAYLLSPGRADTLNPSDDRPDYVVMSSEDGTFRFSYVAPGTYRVFALRDKASNTLYDVEIDPVGIPMRDVVVQDSLPSERPLRFRLFTADTTRPSIQRAEALHDRRVRVKFNETVFPQPIPERLLFLRDSATAERQPVIAILAPQGEQFTHDLFLGTPLTTARYELIADSLFDDARNMIALPDSGIYLNGIARQDTTAPSIIARFPDPRARDVPPDSSFVLVFDRPVSRGITVTLRDSTEADVPLRAAWQHPARVRFSHAVLMDEAAYELCIDLRTVRDSVTSRAAGDSVYCSGFTTGVADRYGIIAGSIRSDDSTGSFRVRVRETGTKDALTRETAADSSRSYRFPRLPEGKYVLDAFKDENDNERYDPGEAFPYRRPEPFGVLRDTIRVRARWETNGVVIPVR